MSGYHSTGSLKTVDYNATTSREKHNRGIDADIDICLTCKKKTCSGKCKRVRFKKKEEA
jgi:radical SAM protein with 4Fe4S-binding SPASM domain